MGQAGGRESGNSLALFVVVFDELIGLWETQVTKRKLATFFVIAVGVFTASRGGQVRHAVASAQPLQTAPTTQPVTVPLQR
jgi:uncharacterized membrane protein YeiH